MTLNLTTHEGDPLTIDQSDIVAMSRSINGERIILSINGYSERIAVEPFDMEPDGDFVSINVNDTVRFSAIESIRQKDQFARITFREFPVRLDMFPRTKDETVDEMMMDFLKRAKRGGE